MNANWIEVNDARTSEKLWVNAALVTAIDVTQGYTRIRFDKDNPHRHSEAASGSRRHRREVIGAFLGCRKCRTMGVVDVGRSLTLTVARDLVLCLKRPGRQAQYTARCGFGLEETLRRSFPRLLAATTED